MQENHLLFDNLFTDINFKSKRPQTNDLGLLSNRFCPFNFLHNGN
jgi:hypothetical protein